MTQPRLLPALHGGQPIVLAFDESKHPRGEKGTHEGGKFTSVLKKHGYKDRGNGNYAKGGHSVFINQEAGRWTHYRPESGGNIIPETKGESPDSLDQHLRMVHGGKSLSLSYNPVLADVERRLKQ